MNLTSFCICFVFLQVLLSFNNTGFAGKIMYPPPLLPFNKNELTCIRETLIVVYKYANSLQQCNQT